MRNREDLEEWEARTLSRLGLRAGTSRGRRVAESPDPLRTCFQRDRDRVIHSAAFRRLQLKTQVFRATENDHFRTRLTHTLEVSQMARSACLALGLNADLGETVALAHDLGHPPFGHAGEHALDELMREHGGFRHNAQGLRIVDSLEESYLGRDGLNLSQETRLCLLKGKVPTGFPLAEDLPRESLPYLEGQIVDLCDRTAYVCHDLDDAIRSGLVPWGAFAELALPAEASALARELRPELGHPGHARLLRRQTVSAMVSILVRDLVQATDEAIAVHRHLQHPEDVRREQGYLATHSAHRQEQLGALLGVLNDRLYRHPDVLGSMERAAAELTVLFRQLCERPERLPERFGRRIPREGRERTVCDYVAGMTDRYVEQLGREIA